jgi:hypothetical protein
MPVFPCFDPTTGASGGAVPGGSADPVTPPAAASESVAAGGSLADVTFGAFTDPGARISSYAATVKNVVGSGTISGTGLGPYAFSGTADSEVITVELDARDASSNVLATAVYTGSIGSPTTGGAWVTLEDYDLTDLDTTSSLSTGTHTLSFASIADTIDVVFSKYSDSGGITAQATNGTGIVIDGGTDTTSAGTISMRPSDWLTSYTADDVQRYVYAITWVFTVDLTANPASSGFFVGVNTGNNTTHNSGDARSFEIRAAADGINETVKIRLNTTATGVLTTQALRTTRTVTAIVHFGEIVQLMDNNGHTIPTPDVSQGLPTYTAGSDAVGRNDDTRVYQNSGGIRAFFSCSQTGDITCSRIIVQRFE